MSQLLIRTRRAGQDRVWIGLRGDTEGDKTVWDWSDGTPLRLEAWEQGAGAADGAADGAEAGAGAELGAGDGAGAGSWNSAGWDAPQLCAAFSARNKSWSPVPCETKLRFFCGYQLDKPVGKSD